MKIRTTFNYNYSDEKYEKNTLPSRTILEDFETLEEKLARFAGIYPSDKGLEYSEELDITEDPGFDIADYELHETNERIQESILTKKRGKKNEKNDNTVDSLDPLPMQNESDN